MVRLHGNPHGNVAEGEAGHQMNAKLHISSRDLLAEPLVFKLGRWPPPQGLDVPLHPGIQNLNARETSTLELVYRFDQHHGV